MTENWKTQIRKGYLELCILLLIRKHQRLYGFELLERLAKSGLEVKEGTLYPLLNRMASENQLHASWETENLKGHPRKFYALTRGGEKFLDEMSREFDLMIQIYKQSAKAERG
jgi:PadR family transcriptional regulator, regulatory protein PadR